MASSSTRSPRKWLWWLIGGTVAVVVLVVAAPFVYIHFIETDPPPKLHLSTTPPTTAASSAPAVRAPLAGTWKVGSGSTVGYRVKEVLFGQNNDAAGRTNDVSGSITIAGTTVRSGQFTADLTTVKSDRGQRDNAFQGRIMDTADFPTATFKLTKPIALGREPADATLITVQATGDLTLHGQTRSVTFPLQARRTGNVIEATGEIPVKFSDYQIGDPSFGPVTTEDHGILEFLLEFQPS